MLNPFAHGEETNTKPAPSEEGGLDLNAAFNRLWKKKPVLDPTTNGSGTLRTSSPSRSNASAMFAEPDARSTSEECSVDGKDRVKKNSRPKTCYSICHAPPASSTRQKLHRRPRSLLQMHKLNPYARPIPAFDVISSANFSVRLTRAITKVFTTKHGLCPNDLVILNAEDYNAAEEDEERAARDMIGLICKGRKDDEKLSGGSARIQTPSGKEWNAYPISNGGYEFSTVDEHGLIVIVRWVPKRNKDGSRTGDNDGARNFNFSTISPNSRRHPVIASLSKSRLDINDTYKLPEPASFTPLSTPQQGGSILTEAMEQEGEKDLCETDDQLREIIMLTAIWVTFKEGWSPSIKYDSKDSVASLGSPSKIPGSPVATPPASPGVSMMEKRSSLKTIGSGIIRQSSLLSKSNRRSTGLSISETGQSLDMNGASNKGRSGRTRADSTSTVLVHRAASNRRRSQQPTATWRSDFDVTKSQVAEAPHGSNVSDNDLISEYALSPASQTSDPLSPQPSSADERKNETSMPYGKADHNESTTTTDTDTARSLPPTDSNPCSSFTTKKSKRKSGSWRRLLSRSKDARVQ